MSKFTPGPWAAICRNETKKSPAMAMVATQSALGKLCIDALRSGKDHAEDCANARLIAAAPALYEALLDMSERHCDKFCGSEHDAYCVAARAALAKVDA